MALFRGIQEYIALDANNITLVLDSGNIVWISGNIFLYPPQGHPILYNYYYFYRPVCLINHEPGDVGEVQRRRGSDVVQEPTGRRYQNVDSFADSREIYI